jgi:hypothetical protein
MLRETTDCSPLARDLIKQLLCEEDYMMKVASKGLQTDSVVA